MIYDYILIRYGEISTKGQNRKKFVDRLKRNISDVLARYSNIFIEQTRDRMYIRLNGEQHEPIMNELQKVFGIQSFSLAVKVKNDVEEIKKVALEVMKEYDQESTTFKVTARRAYKQFPLDTNELNYAVGSHILKNTNHFTVDVRNPDINLRVEVREDATYITSLNVPGAGGLPVGTSGKAMLMLSGGIDSPVAGYLAMKRGLEVEAVHFYSPPFTSERSKQKVIDLAQKLTNYSGKVKLHIVPFTTIQQAIQKQVPENYTMTSTRRMMLKITDRLRHRHQGLAIATGESLGQVASQTLESMFAINNVTSTPILRPLITMDKTEIIEIAKEIDTHDISIQPYEDCCTIFTPAAPKTRPKLEKVERYEQFIDFDSLIEEAVQGTETMELKAGEIETVQVEEDLF
ncbi:tRNA uracil 4-sulfurtransferase ThiI [Priestia abyssalis]|uniref:tRNA uracil 4-sulfurtransferase ThiI n=1 Tax=Priestia abyssalis TaxID=1221450 RepID=UPI00099501B4|nr:tRNA uracil 4-sulfurtransferase ThiI [Priestia abyssalis]